MVRVSAARQSLTRFGDSVWWVGALVIAVVVIGPLAVVGGSLMRPPGEGWHLVADLLLPSYVKGTVIMVVGVAVLTLLFGVGSAWIVTVWEFPGRRFFCFALLLPMALPTYIAAYGYSFAKYDVRDPFVLWVRSHWGMEAMAGATSVFNHGLAILVMALVLYPYVFIAARIGFCEISGTYMENSRLLGHQLWGTFFRVGVPLARPAIVGGLLLALLEVMNEYGAMVHYGIETLTTGIFVSWTDLGDVDSSVRLAGVAMIIVFAMIAVERLLRGKARYHSHRTARHTIAEATKTRRGALAAFASCSGLFFFAFILPTYKLVGYALMAWEKVNLPQLLRPLVGSAGVALGASLGILVAALILAYAARLFKSSFVVRALPKVCMLGYAVPGAVVAIAVLVTASTIGDWLSETFSWPSLTYVLFTAGPAGLIIAYAVRFMTPALAPIEGGIGRISGSLDEASKVMGRSSWATFFRVHLPLMRLPVIGATVVLFVDILKELPLTLVLRPPNIETLATQTYSLIHKEERIAEGAIPALILIATGVVGVFVIHCLIRTRTSS